MDKKIILDHLLGKKCQEKSGLYIVSIVGTGGMGKTTLAQLAYSHSEEQLKNTLLCGAAGSRILATTRKESVVKMMRTTSSWEKEEELKEIGEKIADKCKGLPLAIKTLGNLLRIKNSEEEWKNVLNSEVWQLDEFERDISPALLLSYYDLPPAIQRCFSFCAVFPKDSVIERDELIKLWMAQSYLKSDGRKEMEMVGRTYFEYLAARSFFQDFEKYDDGNIIRCKMHDIVHDFAQFLTQNECFIVEVDNQQMESIDLSFKKIRHTTLVVRESTPNFTSTYNMKNLHTLLAKEAFNSRVFKALPNLLRHLTCLKALDLSSNQLIEELPRELDKVKDAGEAEKAELKNKVHLQDLTMKFGTEGTKGVAEALQPHPNLKFLCICEYGDREWPNWMMGSSLAQLKTLNLDFCLRCPCLPPLGQLPVLENLWIRNMYGVKYIGSEFLGSSSTVFPKLKELTILGLLELKQWEIKEKEERSIMPCLNHLSTRGCPKLEGLPDHVLQRTTLQTLNIRSSPILKRRYRKDIGEDRHKISHIPEVEFSSD
ncbi:putative disease resistance protein RGA4 [Vitis vinifera]|uniref:Putative disease resistance protein RGA4 n=1 Tax=Vitis vinifera TaxID=29760 RepID=A0A438C4H3_VITVI|nr:putative disease resistance protein RGA4 [Vitis vinifera]